MAGTDPRFSATKFRDAIHFAMNMGLPETSNERATFRWTKQQTFARQDSGGSPFDLTAAPVTSTQHADVQIPVAVQFNARPSQSTENSLGEFDDARTILTVLDEDYTLVRGADQVLLGGNTYDIQFVAPPIGLFEVTVYQIYMSARDES